MFDMPSPYVNIKSSFSLISLPAFFNLPPVIVFNPVSKIVILHFCLLVLILVSNASPNFLNDLK